MLLARDLFVVSAENAEDILPALALVGDQRLEQRERRGLESRPEVLERTQGLRHLREPGPLGQEPADLEVGVHAGIEAAEQLQQDLLPEHDVRVTLLGPIPGGSGRGGRLSPAGPRRPPSLCRRFGPSVTSSPGFHRSASGAARRTRRWRRRRRGSPHRGGP